ncbi:hypothetical protein QOZ80_3BG0296870 [Eleusine coracana subsp. coracana]|nr:hypothetical protein QOZ80_3BG0296870 [Eleusine coracana subsp. coracana]
MGLLPASRPVPHADDEGASATAWTGKKRLKTISRTSPLSSSEDGAEPMDVQLQEAAQGVEEGRQEEDSGSVFSGLDQFSLEEVNRFCAVLDLRETSCQRGRIEEAAQDRDEIYRRIRQLRLHEIIKRDGLDDTTSSQDVAFFDWDDVNPSQTFDWTAYSMHRFRDDLDIYQRIVPTRKFFHEYLNWQAYCYTLTNYETDEEYVKYWNEIAKKIKWIEGCQHLDAPEKEDARETGCNQAIKIAAGFSHLPLSLAISGYEEYYMYMTRISLHRYRDRLYFELWKRVRRQNMTFQEALEELRTNNLFSSRLKAVTIQEPWFHKWEHDFKDSMKLSLESVSEDVTSEQFTSMLDGKYHLDGQKLFVDFVKKKLEIARRLHLLQTL